LLDKVDDLLPGTCIDILSSIHTSHHLLPRITVGKSFTVRQREEEEAEDGDAQAHTQHGCRFLKVDLELGTAGPQLILLLKLMGGIINYI
jgi:hypothetical protein